LDICYRLRTGERHFEAKEEWNALSRRKEGERGSRVLAVQEIHHICGSKSDEEP
jgi:hypothetical protein